MKRKRIRRDKKLTLCWYCANAVPSRDGERGCPWSVEGNPVEGWSATGKTIKCKRSGCKDKMMQTFFVRKCPLYVEG